MAVLIIDDDDFEAGQLKKDLLDLGYKEIHHGRCLMEALDKVEQLDDGLELVVLDWNFPTLLDEEPVVGEGEFVLDDLERTGSEVPVIICSGDSVEINSSSVIAVTTPDTFRRALITWSKSNRLVPHLVLENGEVIAIRLGGREVELRELATQIQNHSLEVAGTVWAHHKNLLTECEAFKGFPKLKALAEAQ